MPTLDVDGGHIHYEVHGTGYPVLLFAPGFLSSRIERWRSNPARPGVTQDWLDPIAALAGEFRLIALDVRNAGSSRVAMAPDDDWTSYTGDHLALLAHLGIKRCHVMGACIGVSFALGLAQARPETVTAMVLQNPIGIGAAGSAAIDREFAKWADEVRGWPEIDERLLPGFHQRMFGGDFIFSVTRDFVRRCTIPTLLMPGDDDVHAADVSADLARAPRVETMAAWKGTLRDEAMRRISAFFIAHRPFVAR